MNDYESRMRLARLEARRDYLYRELESIEAKIGTLEAEVSE